MEVICAIIIALFGIGFGIFMALHREMPLPCAPAGGTRRYLSPQKSTSN